MALPVFITALLKAGLSLVANAALVKGKEYIEEKTGVKLQENMPPEDLAKVRQWELENEPELAALRVEDNRLAVANAIEVNATMREEGKSEHWPQYAWRPAIGFAVALVTLLAGLTILIANIGAMFFGKAEALQHVPGMITALAALLVVVTPILGIASWHRGRAQVEEAKK